MQRISQYTLPVLLTMTLLHCPRELPNPFEKTTPADPCDPLSNVYKGEKHYIDRQFVKDDGTLDYGAMFKSDRVQSSPCDPLNKKKDEKKDNGAMENLEK